MADENPNSNIPKSQLEVLRKISIQLAALNANQAKLIDLTTDRLNQETGVVTDRLRAASMPNGAPAILAPGARQPTRPAWTERYSPAIDALDERMANQPPGQTHPGASRAPNASRPPGPSIAAPTEVSARRRLAASLKGGGSLLDRADRFLNQERPVQAAGSVGSDASTPHPLVPGMTRGQVANSIAEQMNIPQFGEWQLNDNLALARDAALRIATNRPEGSMSGRVMGTVAGALNYAHANAANMVAAGRLYRGLHSKGKELMDVGTDLGYSPNDPAGPLPGIIPGLGDRNPLDYVTSSAGQQALGLKWDAFKLARGGAAGVDKQQADEIYAAVTAQGFSNQRSGFLGMTTGGHAQDIANNFVAPLVAQSGAAPQDIAQFATFLRNGSVNMGQLGDTLARVADGAKAANETTSQMYGSLFQFVETMNTQFGATANNAAQIGTGYTAATGLDPQILAQSMANPMYQGLALGRYGVMPGALGNINPGLAGSNQVDQLQMLQRAFGGLNRTQYTTIDGQRVASVTGQDQMYGMMSQVSGIPAGDIKRLLDPKVQAGNNAIALLGRDDLPGSFDYRAAHGDAAGASSVWSTAVTEARKAGVSSKDISSIMAKDSTHPEQMAAALVKAITAKSNPVNTTAKSTINVEFTGMAKKFFQQDLKKLDPRLQQQIDANSGGGLLSQLAASPISPTNILSDLTGGMANPVNVAREASSLASTIGGLL